MSKTFDFEITLSKREDKAWKIAGFVLAFCTLGIGFIFFYSNFFERELYMRRKALLAWLCENPLPSPRYFATRPSVWEWKLPSGFSLYLWEYNMSPSLYRGTNCVLCSFRSGILDKRNDAKVRKILKESTGK